MPLNFPDSADVVLQRMKTDVANALPQSDPFSVQQSVLIALLIGYAGRNFEIYNDLEELIKQCFVDTATGEFLARFGFQRGIQRLPATKSQGNITVTGTATTIIPVSTQFRSSNNVIYDSTLTSSIENLSIDVSSLTSAGLLATIVTVDDHNWANNLSVTISGADQPEYNGTFLVTVLDEVTATYILPSVATSPATGSIIADATFANVNILSQTNGSDTNKGTGSEFNLVTPIAGVDDVARAQAFGIIGGSDIESDSELRKRIIFNYQNPITAFNEAGVSEVVLSVPGVTRIFFDRPTSDTSDPPPGEARIYFMRDNDETPIPGPGDIDQVREVLDPLISVERVISDIQVLAPIPVVVDFSIPVVVPNTQTMKNSIEATLDAFFSGQTSVGENVREIDYLCAINSTVDTQTGERIQSFTVSSPTGDITVSTGEIAILGTVSF